MYHNRNVSEEASEQNFEYVSLDALLNESDFVICTCAATQQTEKIFNRHLFEKMKPTAVFINVSRGIVVNQSDLYVALKNKVIAAAGELADTDNWSLLNKTPKSNLKSLNKNNNKGLDVTTPEPLPPDHELYSLDNCIITPHISSAEINTRTKMATITASNIVNGLSNKPLVHQIKI